MGVRALALLALLALACASCGSSSHGTSERTRGPHVATESPLEPDEPTDRLAYAHRVGDPETWRRLAARPENHVVARTEVVKFLIDLEDGERIWFTDTERWPIHYHFARAHIRGSWTHTDIAREHAAFNLREYRRPERRFAMGSLVHYIDPDVWTFELAAGDNLAGERVVRAFELVRGAVFFGERLRYRPVSRLHEELIAPVADRIPRTTAEEVFAGLRYQPLTRGAAFGTLRFVPGALDPASVRPDQILVLEELPDQIPVSAAVISAPMQAPLGHLAILCATRGTPNMALRGAMSDPALRALEGRLVRLDVGQQDHALREATRAEAEASWAEQRPRQPLVPALDARDRGLPELCTLRVGDTSTVGAKAAQLGEVCAMRPPVRTPGGFAIPFHHYLGHLERAGIARSIPAMLADGAFVRDSEVRGRNLAQLRAAIEQATVDPALVAAVRARLARFPGQPRVIFRSSTNAEDLPGFTGAGLYRSIVVPASASDADIAGALSSVWSSVWLQGAFEERDWYRIDQTRVAMGILVQPFVDGASVNGVAITANPYFAGRPGLVINAQMLGGSVTGAQGDEIPEQHLVYTYSETIEAEVLARSSRSPDRLLLEARDVVALAGVLQQIHEHFVRPHWSDRAVHSPNGLRTVAADVEFLIAGPQREIVILQARPFVVVYDHEDQL